MGGTLIFDGDCGFCTKSADLAEHRVSRPGHGFTVVPWQFADLAEFGVSEAQVADAVTWIDESGDAHFGAAAIAKALRAGRAPFPVLGRVLEAPGIRHLAAALYPWIAEHRHQLPGGTPACKMPQS